MREPQRQRIRTRDRRRSRRRTTDRDDALPDTPESAAGDHGRRGFLGGLAALLGIGAVAGTYLASGVSRALPEPASQAAGPEYRAATLALRPAPQTSPPPADIGWNLCREGRPSDHPSDLDLVLAIDTTGSMGGVINDVKANVAGLLQTLAARGGAVRVGVVAYRDYGDTYVVRPVPLTALGDPTGLATLTSFIAGLQAAGGGDWPEAMASALDAATSMEWRGTVPAAVVVIADAPPHPGEAATAEAIARNFHSKIPESRISLIDTGSGGNALMRSLPKLGGGKYVTYDGRIMNSLFPAITGCESK